MDKMGRREFFKIAGITGLTTALSVVGCKESSDAKADSSGKISYPQIPRRKLGKTDEMVPVLSHGIMYNLVENQIVLKKGLQWGIKHWDTSNSYAGGNSELGIGKYLKKHPEVRKDVFIVSKASSAKTPKEMEKKLQLSLKRMNTNYIDLFYGIHGLSDPNDLTPEIRKWAESAKKRKLIKHFGFSTHKNMANCLTAASKLDWIDAIMTSWNFRLMQDDTMEKAVDACYKANIGLIAMKVMGLTIYSDGDKKLTQHFIKKGYTDGQAKLKAVLDDKRFAAACITMENTALITTNAAAALDKTKLSKADWQMLQDHALATCSGYCSGCNEFCDSAIPDMPVVSDVMRYLMYYNSYGDEQKAQDLFREIPQHMRMHLLSMDFTATEKACPKNLPIGSFIKEAIEKLS